MAIITVRKDGSGTYTTITEAYMAAQPGDTIDIGAGTFTESIEVYKNNLTFVGAGKNQTIVQGNYSPASIQTATNTCSWISGNNFFTLSGVAAIPAFSVGMSIGETGLSTNSPGGAQITQIDSVNRKIYINKNFTNSLSNKTMKHWGRVGTFEVRASGFTMSGVKVIDGPNGGGVAALDQGSIFLGASNANAMGSKLTGTSTSGFNIYDCEFVAEGDSAMMAEANAAVGNGTVTGCTFSGKTFIGQYAPAGGNAVKQGVVFQSANLPITFTNNKLDVICGGMTNATPSVYSGNQIATIDAYGSTVTGNQFKGKAVDAAGSYFNMTGLALRMRNGGASVSSNVIKGFSGLVTGGYLILPTFTNLSGKTIPVGEVVIHSSRYFKCTQAHLYAADKTPVTGASWASYWIELTGTASEVAALLIANGKAYYQANSGTNITITASLVSASQPSAGQPVATNLDKAQLKLVPKVSSSVVFSDEANWKLVSCIFKKIGGSQRIVMSFRDFSAQKLGKLKAGMAGGDNFELHKIVISKSDRTLLVINRSDIAEVSDNDFVLKS